MESLTSVKITTSIVNKAKKIKKETGVPIGKQFEMAFMKSFNNPKTKNND